MKLVKGDVILVYASSKYYVGKFLRLEGDRAWCNFFYEDGDCYNTYFKVDSDVEAIEEMKEIVDNCETEDRERYSDIADIAYVYRNDVVYNMETGMRVGKQKQAEPVKQEQVKSESVKTNNNNNNNKGVVSSMLNVKKFFGDFGQVEDGSVAMTLTGQIAVRRANGDFVRYNKENETIENQMDLVIKELGELMFIMPSTTVNTGDIIKQKGQYYQVLTEDNGQITAIDLNNGTKVILLKEKNILGFHFFYKITNLCNFGGQAEGKDNNLFANPMMLLLLGDKEGDSGNSKMNDLLPIMMLSQSLGIGEGAAGGFNPMMLMLMGDGKMDMKTLALMSMFGQQGKK